MGEECGGREATSAVVQADDGGLDQGGGMGWEMVDAGYFLEVQLRGLADGLDVESRMIPRLGQWGCYVCVHTKYTLLQGQDSASILCLKAFSGSHGCR